MAAARKSDVKLLCSLVQSLLGDEVTGRSSGHGLECPPPEVVRGRKMHYN